MTRRQIVSTFVFFLATFAPSLALHAADVAAPATPASLKTGEIDLTFTERSPLSTRTEIARRLTMAEGDLGADYDLSKRPFKAYIPKTYDGKTPVGIFVYLGYKDSESVATPWEPVLDKSHMIFITPVCHNGERYPNSVPYWQMVGLAMDAVHNLRQQYRIDPRRINLMSWNTGSMQMSFATADVFTGVISTADRGFCQKLPIPSGGAYDATFPMPPKALFERAKTDHFVFVSPDLGPADGVIKLRIQVMQWEGFKHLAPVQASLDPDLHYPNFQVGWFEQTVLPFLDTASPASSAEPKVVESVAPAGKKPGEIQTGEMDLTFTERSPLSGRKELARRLSLKDAEMGPDYDIAKCPFKVYIPSTYTPSTPVGVIVYLGYKDSEKLPIYWEPVLDKAHLIFITSVAHHAGDNGFPNSVPVWQATGLALDAIHNLKHRYNIDLHRTAMLSNTGAGMQMQLACADAFNGFIVAGEVAYPEQINLPDRRYYKAQYPAPPGGLLDQAKRKPVIVIFPDTTRDHLETLVPALMKQRGFAHLLSMKIRILDVLDYHILDAAFLEKTLLPFLGSTWAAQPKTAESATPTPQVPAAPTPDVSPSPASPAPATAAANPEAQHMLDLAKLYLKNKQSKLARTRLEVLLKYYPNDPTAAEARQLLGTIPAE